MYRLSCAAVSAVLSSALVCTLCCTLVCPCLPSLLHSRLPSLLHSRLPSTPCQQSVAAGHKCCRCSVTISVFLLWVICVCNIRGNDWRQNLSGLSEEILPRSFRRQNIHCNICYTVLYCSRLLLLNNCLYEENCNLCFQCNSSWECWWD